MLRVRTSPIAGIDQGLAARIADPLWLLARQWQFGEFTAEDAASPVLADVEFEVHLIDQWRPAGAGWRPYDVKHEPLERLVEQEPPTVNPRLRIEGGLRLRELLLGAALEDLMAGFAARCPFPVAAEPEAGDPPFPPPPGGLADAIRRRLPDGAALADMMARLISPEIDLVEAAIDADVLGFTEGGSEVVVPVANAWLVWWDARAPAVPRTRPRHPEAWDENRMEYAFDLRASAPDLQLTAAGYTGGRLDWWAADAHGTGAAGGPAGQSFRLTGVPAPARFGGMPLPRFWEIEDARFDPGSIDAAASDLGRLLLVAFATVYSNDWFVLPVRLPVASLSRITAFTVTDVFGGPTRVERAGASDDGWNLFGLTDALAPAVPGGERGTSPWFFLPPALPQSIESAPVESVLLLRDEMANLAWAVESLVTDDAGRPVNRAGRWAARPPAPPEQGALYRVATEVPDHWHPLAPEKLPDLESIVLRLLPLALDADATRRRGPLGALLAGVRDPAAGPLWLHEEEVPRSGAEVVRTRQHARWHDGSQHGWTGRRRSAGRGEGSSGLRFDIVEEGRGS